MFILLRFSTKGFENSLEREERCPFSLFERKRTKKKQTSVPLDCVRAINFVAPSFSSPGIAVPQNSASATRRAKRLEIIGSRTGGSNLMARVRDRPHHANHAEENPRHDSWKLQPVWEQVGASRRPRIFPPSYFSPNRLLRR